MYKFLDNYDSSNFSQEDINYLSISIMSNVIDVIIVSPTKSSAGWDGFTVQF
jgi:hypothetical protein